MAFTLLMQKKILEKAFLHILKALYSFGSEINSLENVGDFMNSYRDDGLVEVSFKEDVMDVIVDICEKGNLIYVIE